MVSSSFAFQSLWYNRAMMVWAAMELYVMEMAAEEEQTWRTVDGEGLRYPRLEISHLGLAVCPPRRSSDGSRVSISRTDLCARLDASNNKTDRFDHPLIFARSSMPWEADGPDGRARRIGNNKFLRKEGVEGAFESEGYRKYEACYEANGVSTLLTFARVILARTPFLQSLSLTGYLERAICGPDAPTNLEALRSLSLGPPPERWGWVPPLRPLPSILEGLQSLRVCGYLLRKEQVAGIVGATMPRLMSFEWSYAKQITGNIGENASR